MGNFTETEEQSIPRYAKICRDCGTLNVDTAALPGSGWIEAVLWLSYLLPGLIYSIWRRSMRQRVCLACGKRELLQVDTPVGAALLKEYHADTVVDEAQLAPDENGPSTFWKVACVLLFIAGLSSCLFSSSS